MKCIALFVVVSVSVMGLCSSELPPLRATIIHEHPYIDTVKNSSSTNLSDYTGYIPDFLQKLSLKIHRKFTIHLVPDKKYGAKVNGKWNGMIGEVLNDNADIAAAPITTSEERKEAVEFTETFMTFDTLVIMKKGYNSSKIRSAAELHYNNTDVKVGVVKDGFTENFFKTTSQQVYDQMYKRMDKNSLPTTSKDGVTNVRQGDGKYAFVIEAATADYWMNKQPCDLVAFRLGSALHFHDYSFAIKKHADFKAEINNAMREMKSQGEHDMLRAKWWPTECSGAAFSGPSAGLSSVLALLTAAVGSAIRFRML